MALTLEDHVFRVLENQGKLYDVLGEHNWSFGMATGTLTFVSEKQEPLASCPVQILGSKSEYSNTWLWAWANEASGIPTALLRWAETIKRQARAESRPLFLSGEEILLRRERFDAELAIICTGALGLFTYYACSYEGGCMFTAIERCPEAERMPRDILLVSKIIETGICALDFDHKRAMLAYLGRPQRTENDRFHWMVGSQELIVTFDGLGRIAKWETTLRKA
jgi:hypothetical protein